MSSQNPPSFDPSDRRPRPHRSGARPVRGSDAAGALPDSPRRATARQAQQPSDASATTSRPRQFESRPATPRRTSVRAADPWASQDDQPGHTRVMPTARSSSPRGERGEDMRTPPSYAPQYRRPASQYPAATPPQRPAVATPTAARRPARRRRGGGALRSVLIFLLVLVLLWPVGLGLWANMRITHTDAVPAGPSTPGTTWLLAGSDSRADGSVADGTPGERADTIMLLHKPANGPAALISLPRDTYVVIPGHGPNKLNAAYAIGGPALLAQTVEDLTGLGVDHYVEVGMGGVASVVDAVGGVTLCLDYDVSDEYSGLQWTAGCHDVDGQVALQFSRMRYSDPQGDLGRTARQRQVVSAITGEAASSQTLINPVRQVELVGAGTDALMTDPDTGIIDLGRMALAFREATGPGGVVGTPPVAQLNYQPGGIGSTVLLDEAKAPQFFRDLANGDLTPADG